MQSGGCCPRRLHIHCQIPNWSRTNTKRRAKVLRQRPQALVVVVTMAVAERRHRGSLPLLGARMVARSGALIVARAGPRLARRGARMVARVGTRLARL